MLDRDNVHALATGTLTTFDSQIDVTTGTIRMRATFANPDGVLFPNQFVNVRLLVDTMTGATLAPNAAIQLGASGNFVYLLTDDSTVAKRDVTIGPTDGKHTVVASGLKPGDRVVIDGVDRLRDGASVKIVDNPPGAAAQAPAQGHEQAVPTGGGRRGPASSPSPRPVRGRRGLAGYGSGFSDRPAGQCGHAERAASQRHTGRVGAEPAARRAGSGPGEMTLPFPPPGAGW